MKHKHHIIPRHMGGSNDPSNLVEVTVEEHAELHHQLWEDLGYKEDYIAWQALSGQITTQEATLAAIRLSIQKRIDDGSFHFITLARKRIENGSHPFLDSKFQSIQGKKGYKKAIENGTHFSLRPQRISELAKQRVSKGIHHFTDSNFQRNMVQKALREGTHSSQKQHVCPNCGKIGKGGAMKRFHYDNCKERVSC
jgi:hypothetical protein